MHMFSDSDWAGDQKTRRSTSGGIAMMGSHCIKHWCRMQHAVALSSAEAELYAGVFTATEGLGIQAMALDLGIKLFMTLYLDAKAAIAIMSREGLSKVKHIETRYLCIQDAIKVERFALRKIKTDDNPADFFTKPLDITKTNYFTTAIGLRFMVR